MDLISKQAVLNEIDKYIDKAQSTGTKDDFISFAELGVKALPSAFEGMTNGEVMKTIFSEVKVERDGFLVRCVFIEHEFTTTEVWWDSPYKGVSE